MPYSSVEELKVLRKRIQEVVHEKSSLSRQTSSFRIVNLEEVRNYQFYVYRIKDNFIINDRTHVFFLNKEFTLQLDEITSLIKELYEKYQDVIKNDKLIVPCMLPIDEYCPVCSFQTSILRLIRYHLLHYEPSKFIEKSSEIYEILTLLNKFSTFFNELLYTVQVCYIPCAVYDPIDIDMINILVLKLSKRYVDSLLTSLVSFLKEENLSISDINSFSFKVSFINEEVFFEILDINERNVTEQMSVRLNDVKVRLHSMNFDFLFRNRTNFNTTPIVYTFDKILDKIYSRIEQLL